MNVKEHLLVLLMEEAAEVAKETAKALRFGLEGHNTLNPEVLTNQERMIDELNDLMGGGGHAGGAHNPARGLAKR